MIRRALYILCLCLLFAKGVGAQTGNESEVYEIYWSQVIRLLQSRGLPENEIERIMSVFRTNDIRSDEKLASVLGGLYPAGKGILFIFYQFSNDTLRRVTAEPGKIVEVSRFPVTRAGLLQLGSDFNHVLGLYKTAGKRMPVKRGGVIKPPPPSAGLNYDTLVQRATKLLLPAAFSRDWRHIVIIPSLNLGTLPFYLLRPFADSTELIDHCSYSVAPGIGDLVALRMKVLKKAASFWNGEFNEVPFDKNRDLNWLDTWPMVLQHTLFVSNPEYPTNTNYDFPDLPGAEREVRDAIPMAGSFDLLRGKTAQKETVLHLIGKADLAYFATHGVASEEDPMNKSFLVLSGRNPFLTAKDIIDSRSSISKFPSMVILSACQTGLGKSMEAGVAGLARSFMLAGSEHVVMSLWNVDDNATAYLMNRFMFYLKQPSAFTPSEPMRKAMLDTRKKFPRASQWAGFTVFGVVY